ncbi:glycosyltransferase family 2 protein [Methylobacterium sp. P31]
MKDPADIQVAVVVPAYNSVRTLERTIHSILRQTHNNLDVIIVDDGSTDATSALIRQISFSNERVRYHRQPNEGAAAARNTGAALTAADYIAFCDADDLWSRDKIESQLKTLLSSRIRLGFVYSGFAVIDANDRVLRTWTPTYEGWIFDRLLRENFIGNGSSALFRRECFEQIGGFQQRHCPAEDLALYLDAARRFPAGVVCRPQVGYRRTEGSLSSNGFRVLKATTDLLKQYADEMPSARRTIQLHIRGVLIWQIIHALRRRQFSDALHLFMCDPGLIIEVARSYIPERTVGLIQRNRKHLSSASNRTDVVFWQLENC